MKIGALYRGDHCLLPRVWDAVTAWERTRGLLGRAPLAADEGMLIRQCRLVHTIGMRYALDLAFLDSDGRVRKLAHRVPPGRMAGSISACMTLELAAGTLASLAVRQGDLLVWQEGGR